jgi:hypothetical protein
VVLEDGLTSSFNHDLRMTLESLIEDVMLGEFIFPEQSKTKANDFVARVANEKRCLHSNQQPLVVLEDGLTSSFNHNLQMTLESLIKDVDELLRRRDG